MRALLIALLGACAYTGEFPCTSHEMCKNGDELGFCERSGYCTFTDESCATHRRYSELSPGDIAGTCLDGVVTGTFVTRQLSYDENLVPSLIERPAAANELTFGVELEDGTTPTVDYRESDGAFSFVRGNARYQLAYAYRGNGSILQLTAPHVRIGPIDPSRPDRVPVTRPTTIAFQQTPSMAGTTFIASTGVFASKSLGQTGSNTSFDWRTVDGGAPGLLDASKHDRLYFLMFAPPTLGAMYQSLSAHATHSLTQVDGMTTMAAGVLTPAAKDLCVALQRMGFADYTRLISALPTGRNGATAWYAHAAPVRSQGIAGATLLAYGTHAPPTDGMPMVQITNPVPNTSILLAQNVTIEASVALPNLSAVALPAEITVYAPVDPTDASCSTTAVLRSTVGIGGKLVVDGTAVDANNTQVTLGANPQVTIRWGTAVDGPGHHYSLALHELADDGLGATTITAIPNTTIAAGEPNIRLPKNLFQSGRTYIFALATQLGRSGVANGDLVTLEYPFEGSSTWSYSFVIR